MDYGQRYERCPPFTPLSCRGWLALPPRPWLVSSSHDPVKHIRADNHDDAEERIGSDNGDQHAQTPRGASRSTSHFVACPPDVLTACLLLECSAPGALRECDGSVIPRLHDRTVIDWENRHPSALLNAQRRRCSYEGAKARSMVAVSVWISKGFAITCEKLGDWAANCVMSREADMPTMGVVG